MRTRKLEGRLTVLSPVFIGSGEKIAALGYLKEADRIHVLDESAFFRAVLRMAAAGEDLKRLMRGFGMGSDRSPSASQVLASRRIDMRQFLERHKEVVRRTVRLDCSAQKENEIEFEAFIRDGNDRPYLPGSSLKGLIRTALLRKVLKSDPGLFGRAERHLRGALASGGGDPFLEAMQRIEQDAFGFHDLGSGEKQAKPGPQTDLFRFVRVPDVRVLEDKDRMYVVRLVVQGRKTEGAPVLVEALTECVLRVRVELVTPSGPMVSRHSRLTTVFERVFGQHPEKIDAASAAAVMNESLKEWGAAILEEERRFFADGSPVRLERFYDYLEREAAGAALVKLGKYTKWYAKTIADLFPALRADIVRKISHKADSERLFPATRAIIKDYCEPKNLSIPGWCALRFDAAR